MTNRSVATRPGLGELRTVLDALADPSTDLPWSEARQFAGRAVPLAWGELKATGAWDKLTPADRAALYWALASGHCLHTGRPPEMTDRQSTLTELVRDCAYFATHGEPHRPDRWPEAEGRYEQREAAHHQLAWLHDLRPAWRAEVFHVLDVDPCPVADPGPADWAQPSCVWDALADVQRRIGREESPTGEGGEAAQRFASLPEGWQVECLRRIGRGRQPLPTITEAAEVIDVLPRFGVALRLAPPP
ncbi:hypothetical protein [Streptomyces sp. NPDC049906]|uniref:hypothetical protein n=1 Tax=Streptomyces sp. NPDC049906 TaxID=3155656 RepID=UPI00341ADB2C